MNNKYSNSADNHYDAKENNEVQTTESNSNLENMNETYNEYHSFFPFSNQNHSHQSLENEILNKIQEINFWQDESLSMFLDERLGENNKYKELEILNKEVLELSNETRSLESQIMEKERKIHSRLNEKDTLTQKVNLLNSEIEIINNELETERVHNNKLRQLAISFQDPQFISNHIIQNFDHMTGIKLFTEIQNRIISISNYNSNIMAIHQMNMLYQFQKMQLQNVNNSSNNSNMDNIENKTVENVENRETKNIDEQVITPTVNPVNPFFNPMMFNPLMFGMMPGFNPNLLKPNNPQVNVGSQEVESLNKKELYINGSNNNHVDGKSQKNGSNHLTN